MYLIDTNVISEARRRTPQAVAWMRSVDPVDVYISVITLGEIMRGIAMKQRKDPVEAGRLATWLDGLQRDHGNRILPISDEIALAWGRLSARRTRGDADGLIAATAMTHGLIVVTRNVQDFDDAGAATINPWNQDGDLR